MTRNLTPHAGSRQGRDASVASLNQSIKYGSNDRCNSLSHKEGLKTDDTTAVNRCRNPPPRDTDVVFERENQSDSWEFYQHDIGTQSNIIRNKFVCEVGLGIVSKKAQVAKFHCEVGGSEKITQIMLREAGIEPRWKDTWPVMKLHRVRYDQALEERGRGKTATAPADESGGLNALIEDGLEVAKQEDTRREIGNEDVITQEVAPPVATFFSAQGQLRFHINSSTPLDEPMVDAAMRSLWQIRLDLNRKFTAEWVFQLQTVVTVSTLNRRESIKSQCIVGASSSRERHAKPMSGPSRRTPGCAGSRRIRLAGSIYVIQ
ncbi:hypothetical protein C8R46DRAFT_1036069 [Mycena filopes]|nr:hypothetical protein C8R46DRAFT_1036069 [Mycena filopes]